MIATGGGTGGHIYPALEVVFKAKENRHTTEYWGSLRGQEQKACLDAEVEFQGFASEPIYSFRSLSGLKSAVRNLMAAKECLKKMSERKPDVVFGTGGYSSVPVMLAARRLRVRHVIHEQNSIPGRTQLIASRTAARVCTVFKASEHHFSRDKVCRTGMPVRSAFRNAESRSRTHILVTGGSQGSQKINEAIRDLTSGDKLSGKRVVHIVGPRHFGDFQKLASRDYVVKSFVDAREMCQFMSSADLVVCRSGAGTVSELVATRTRALFVPYSKAFGNHQEVNAIEAENLGFGTILSESELSVDTLCERIKGLSSQVLSAEALGQMAAWDNPTAAAEILGICLEGVEK